MSTAKKKTNGTRERAELGFAEDDVTEQLRECAKSSIQHITDILVDQYRRKEGVNVPPQNIWPILRGQAYELYADICMSFAKDLKQAASNPNMDF